MIWESLRVSLPLFWIGSSTQNIYKIIESAYFSFEKAKHTGNDLPARYFNYRKISGGGSHGQRHSDISFTASRVCTELEKVFPTSCSENRISGVGCRFQEYDFVINNREDDKNKITVSGINVQSSYHSTRTDTSLRTSLFYHSSCPSSADAISTFATPTNSVIEKYSLIYRKSKAAEGSPGGIEMVDREHQNFQ